MANEIHSYSSPVNFGHRDTQKFFDGLPFIGQEKIDGSAISFSVIDDQVYLRSRGQMIGKRDGMFAAAWDTVTELFENNILEPGLIYRGEYLSKRKHNVLAYARVPVGNIILYDIEATNQDFFGRTDNQNFLGRIDLEDEAKRIGLECVPTLFFGDIIPTQEELDQLLSFESILGGTLIEGVVFKNYRYLDQEGKSLMIKYVSPAFRERHTEHTPTLDVVQAIIQEFGGEARWNKAVQHLKEEGVLVGSPQDIGPLMKEVNADLERECLDDIKEKLWMHFRKQIMKGVAGDLPAWYKNKLVESVYDK